MASREDIIKKIQKLFALANDNTSKKEAVAASLMAQRLIAQYDVQDSELYETTTFEIVEVPSELSYRKFKYTLGQVIADNYRCRIYWSKYGRKHAAVFVGRNLDANAAAIVYNKMYACVNDYANSESRKYRGQGGGLYGAYYNSAAIAFIDGIRAELEKQCKELMLVRSQKVDEEFENITAGWGKIKDTSLTNAGFCNYEQGVQAGRDAVRAGRLNADTTKSLGA
jgi:hypothetical protein